MSNVPPIYFFNGLVPAPPLGYQNAQWQTDNGFPIQSFSDSVPSTGSAIVIIADYSPSDIDCGITLAANSPTGINVFLPSPPPFKQWCIFLVNIGSGPLTVVTTAAGVLLNGSTAPVVLNQNQGMYVSTDGVNYFGMRGGGSSTPVTPTSIQFKDNEVPSGLINGSNQTFTLTIPPNPPLSLQLYRNGLQIVLGLDFSFSDRTITFLLIAPRSGDTLRAWYRYLGNGTTPLYRIDFVNQTSIPFQTNLNTFNLIPGVWNTANKQIVYGTFQLIDLNDVLLTFPIAQSGTLIVTPTVYQQTFINQTSVTVPHNLGSLNIIAVVYDSSRNVIVELGLHLVDSNNAVLAFPPTSPQSGTIQIMAPAPYSQSFTGQTTITVTHNLNSLLVKAVAYDASNNQIPFNTFAAVDANNSTLTFAIAQTGRVVVALP